MPTAAWVAIALLALLLAGAVTDAVLTRTRLGRAEERIRELEGLLRRRPVRRRELVAQQAVRAVVGTATRLREGGVTGLLMSSIDELTRWATEDRAEIVRIARPDGTVTILFSDIEESTAINEELGDAGWMKLLAAHDKVVRGQVERHRGHVVKTQGDGFMVVFGEPLDGVRAALGIQEQLAAGARRALRRTPVRVRIGLHVGRVVERDGDYFGRNVAMAARVAGEARGGEVLVSEELGAELVDTARAADLTITPLEPVPLKGLAGQHGLWLVEPADILDDESDDEVDDPARRPLT